MTAWPQYLVLGRTRSISFGETKEYGVGCSKCGVRGLAGLLATQEALCSPLPSLLQSWNLPFIPEALASFMGNDTQKPNLGL